MGGSSRYGFQEPNPIDKDSSEANARQLRTYSTLQTFYLLRMMRLLKLQKEVANPLDVSDWRLRLLNKAIYSTYCDCVALSLGNEARTLMSQEDWTLHK